MTEVVFSTAVKLSGMIRNGDVSCREVVDAHLAHIERCNPGLNAIVYLNAQGARLRADVLDAELSRGVYRGPLHGIPYTVKDFFSTKGIPTQCGSLERAGFIPSEDADTVARLNEAGAVILGKTALSRYGAAVDSFDENLGGFPNNPLNLGFTTGGSSGGEAAAVASGMSIFGLGADMGGSIRGPVGFCGLDGFKPSQGMFSSKGIITSARVIERPEEWNSLFSKWATPGPITRSSGDLLLLFRELANVGNEDFGEPQNRELGDMKFAFSRSLGDVPVSQDTARQFEVFLNNLAGTGAIVEEIYPEQLKALDIEASHEAAASLLAGYMSYAADPLTLFVRKNLLSHVPVPGGDGQSIMRGLLKGTARSRTADGFSELIEKRQKFILSMDSFLSGIDGWLMPAFPVPAFEHKERMKCGAMDDPFKVKIDIDGKKVSWLAAALTYHLLFNFSGHPAACIPAMLSSNGMPMGVQIVGSRQEDMALIRACEEIEKTIIGDFRRPSGY